MAEFESHEAADDDGICFVASGVHHKYGNV